VTYKVAILRRAQKELGSLPGEAYVRVRDAIVALAEDPRPSGCLKLTGRDGWRIRIGSYRVVYEIDDSSRVITVLHVGHRRDVYK
jgi:mRNA interferase RelE/StbE